MINNQFWYINNKLLETSPKDVVKKILEDDKANYERALKVLSEEIELLDSCMSLFIVVVQGAHQSIQDWRSDVSTRAGMAMAEDAFNYALLARHSVLLGYISEVEALFRSCYERTTRCLVFFANSKMAREFLAGKEIWQSKVNKEIKKLESDEENEFYKSLCTLWRHQSKVVHPNLEAFELRNLTGKDLKESVGVEPNFGGILNDRIARAVIGRVIVAMIFILRVVGMRFKQESGEWDREFNRILMQNKALFDKIISE